MRRYADPYFTDEEMRFREGRQLAKFAQEVGELGFLSLFGLKPLSLSDSVSVFI